MIRTRNSLARSVSPPTAATALLVLSFSLIGCGPSNELNRQEIEGSVQLDGKALDHGNIRFLPQADTKGVSSGAIIRDGRYSIEQLKGLPPGTYLVRIYSAEVKTESTPRDPNNPVRPVGHERIPPDYNTNSKHTITVTDGGENRFDYDIRSR